MSVPPLVCSTPPPPDQCYDEVDDDEFDFHYPDSTPISPTPRIDCESFTPFDFTLISSNVNKSNADKECNRSEVEALVKDEIAEDSKIADLESSLNSEKKSSEEECNIEDLDLKLDNLQIDFQNGRETVEDSLNATFDDFGTYLSSSNDVTEDDPFYLPKIADFQPFEPTTSENKSNESSQEENVSIKSEETSDENSTGDLQSNFILDSESTHSNLNISINDTVFVNVNSNTTVENVSLKIDDSDHMFESNPNIVYENPDELKNDVEESNDSSDFNSNTDIASDKNIDDVENILPKSDLFNDVHEIDFDNDDDFDDFAAFESSNIQEANNEIVLDHNIQPTCVLDTSLEKDNAIADDDFGNFDTYNPPRDISNNFKCNRDDSAMVIESGTPDKLFMAAENVFTEDTFYDCENDLNDENKYNLNKLLGQNWTQLLACDVDQSFLFPWNSSTSQKSLLRCLGIDSRNILFGPKWNTNMPRFALNLGTNPLQPIKQIQPDHQEIKSNCDIQKTVTPDKELGWNGEIQYETGDFQTSSYAESLLLDLENLMATLDQMTSDQSSLFKISDLFTSACNERDDRLVSQLPINADDLTNSTEKLPHPNVLNIGRKINLPDTHIFTPTDSETPWSHTIHYSDENNFQNSRSSTCRNSHTEVNKIENVDDFDEFQSFHSTLNESNVKIDFKSTDFPITYDVINKLDVEIPTKVEEDSNTLNMSKPVEESDEFGDFQSADTEVKINSLSHFPLKEECVLQPIKVNHNAPTLNWPAPGDVNLSIFDDFSGVTSGTSGLMENFSVPLVPFTQPSFILRDSKIENKNDEKIPSENGLNITNQVENPNFQFPSLQNSKNDDIRDNFESTITSSNMETDLNDDFDDFQSASSTKIINSVKNVDPGFANIENFSQYNAFNNISPNSIHLPLEPMSSPHISNEYNSKSTQQILQPLSLENYSQINWPEPGINFNNLSQFNPVDFIKSYDENKDVSTFTADKNKDDDGWSDFVSIKPNSNQFDLNKSSTHTPETINPINDDDSDDWSDFVSSDVSSKNTCELKTISQNIHKQANINSSCYSHTSQSSNRPIVQRNLPSNVNILPQLTYVSPKLNININYDSHFQNL